MRSKKSKVSFGERSATTEYERRLWREAASRVPAALEGLRHVAKYLQGEGGDWTHINSVKPHVDNIYQALHGAASIRLAMIEVAKKRKEKGKQR